jgi:hypothetical protein
MMASRPSAYANTPRLNFYFSDDIAIIISISNSRVDNDRLVCTIEVQNIWNTWVLVEQDTSRYTSAFLDPPVFLLGPHGSKRFDNVAFKKNDSLFLWAYTPTFYDSSRVEFLRPMYGALAIDLMARGLVTHALAPDAFDGTAAEVREALRLLAAFGAEVWHPAINLVIAAKDRDPKGTAQALAELASRSDKALEYLSRITGQTITKAHAIGIAKVLEWVNLYTKFRLLGEIAYDTLAAPPFSWSEVRATEVQLPPIVTGVSPRVLETKPVPQTQTLTIKGNNFTPNTMLEFTYGAKKYASRPDRLRYRDATTLEYDIAVGSAIGTWQVSPAGGQGSATFEVRAAPEQLFTITPRSDPNGTIIPGTPLLKVAGESVTFTAVPKDSTYTVAGWYVNGSPIPLTGSTFTLPNIQEDAVVYVTFKKFDPPSPRGFVHVTISPTNLSGAQWQVDDGPFYNSGDIVSVPEGTRRINFRAVAGFVAPAGQSVRVAANELTAIAVTYQPIAAPQYALNISAAEGGTVTVSPLKPQYSQGEVVRVAVGGEYKGYTFDHWEGDVTGTSRALDIVVNGPMTIRAVFIPIEQTVGSLQVNIQPPEAVASGAKWRDWDGPWLDSGVLVSNAFPGQHYLTFYPAPPWKPPTPMYVQVQRGLRTNVTVTYTRDPTPGHLLVTILPPDAVSAGARWTVNNVSYQSGTAAALAPGSYTVTFPPVSGWTAPDSVAVTISPDVTSALTVRYHPIGGSPVISSVTPRLGRVTGGNVVTLEGANFAGPVQVYFGDSPASNVTLVSHNRIECLAPPASTYRTVGVRVTTPNGSHTLAAAYTYGPVHGTNLTLEAHLYGSPTALAAKGNYLYVGRWQTLMVLDASQPANLTPVGRELLLASPIRDIKVLGDYLFIANDEDGVQAVSISDPLHPVLVGTCPTEGPAYALDIRGGVAYVATGSAGLLTLDISNPTALRPLALIALTGSAVAVTTLVSPSGVTAVVATVAPGQSTYAYLLHSLDVSDPAAPVLLASLELLSTTDFGAFAPIKLASKGSFIFAGAQAYNLSGGGSVFLVDVRDPRTPALRSRMAGSGSSVAVNQPYLYALSYSANRLWTYDINDPGNPILVNDTSFSFDRYLGTLTSIFASGRTLFAATYKSVVSIDIQSPQQPYVRTAFTQPFDDNLGVPEWSNHTLYVPRRGGVDVWDVSDPINPRLSESYSTEGRGQATDPDRIRAFGNKGLVFHQGNVDIVSFTASGSIVRAQRFLQDPEYWLDGLWQGSDLYLVALRLTDLVDVLRIYDVSSPSSPNQVAELPVGTNEVYTLTKKGASLILAGQSRLNVVDVTDWRQPRICATLRDVHTQSVRHNCIALMRDLNYMLLAADSSLSVFSISNACDPVKLTTHAIVAHDVRISGFNAFVSVGGDLHVYDIADVMNPRLLAKYTKASGPFTISGDVVYALAGPQGLRVFRLSDVEPPSVFITSPTFAPQYVTTNGILTLGGVASDNAGVTGIIWTSDQGYGGEVTAAENWLIRDIRLLPGTNIITVTAYDQAGNATSDALEVVYLTSKRDQQITFPAPADRTFGDPPFDVVASASSGLPIQFEVVSGPALLQSNRVTLTGAGVVRIRATQPGNAIYNPAPPVEVAINVLRAPQAILFPDIPSQSVGAASFTVDVSASSGLPVSLEVVSGPIELQGNRVHIHGGGTATLRASQPGDANFLPAVPVERTFRIEKLPQIIDFPELAPVRTGDAPPYLEASASSGLPVEIRVVSGPAVVRDRFLFVDGLGEVIVQAAQPGNEQYAPAQPVTRVVRVIPAMDTLLPQGFRSTGAFVLTFYGTIGKSYTLLTSSNLTTWTEDATFLCTNVPVQLTDPEAGTHPVRFYKVR